MYGLLNVFKCPICGGDVSCKYDEARDTSSFFWASLNFECWQCGEFIDVDITDAAEDARREAREYFEEISSERRGE